MTALLLCLCLTAAAAGASGAGEEHEMVGKYLYFGKYNGAPVKYCVVKSEDIDGDGMQELLLFAENVISFKPFDAMGDDLGGRGGQQRNYNGTNLWSQSNIRDWLNSHEEQVVFQGSAPSSGRVWSGLNPYDTEAGFLHSGNLSAVERALIVPKTHANIISEYDVSLKTEGSEPHVTSQNSLSEALENYEKAYKQQTTDKVFLPSISELAAISTRFPHLASAVATQEALDQSKTSYDPINTETNAAYWTRDALADSPFAVRFVSNTGALPTNGNAISGVRGIRPAFYIKPQAFTFRGTGTRQIPYTITNLPADETPAPVEEETKQAEISFEDEQEGVYAIIRRADLSGSAEKAMAQEFVDGMTLYLSLLYANPQKGVYDWSHLEQALAICEKYQKPMKVAVLAGRWVPQWIYTEGGVGKFNWTHTTTLVDAGTSDTEAPFPWDENYLNIMTDMVNDFASKYADNPYIKTIQVTGPALTNGLEPAFVIPQEAIGRLGYDEDKFVNAWCKMIDVYAAAFPKQKIAMCMHNDILGERTIVPSSRIQEYAYSKYGSRMVMQVAYMTHEAWFSPGNSAVDIWLMAKGRMGLEAQLIDIYSVKKYDPNYIVKAFEKAAGLGCRFLELFPDDLIADGYFQSVAKGRERYLLNYNYPLPADAVLFADIQESAYRESIRYLAGLRIVQGDGQGNFNPAGHVTRAEFAKILALAFDLPPKDIAFDDVEKEFWGYDTIAKTVGAGYMSGTGDRVFSPNDSITKEEAAQAAANVLRKKSGYYPPSEGQIQALLSRADHEQQTAQWAKEAVAVTMWLGILPEEGFQPKKQLTRGEAAGMIKRLLELS